LQGEAFTLPLDFLLVTVVPVGIPQGRDEST